MLRNAAGNYGTLTHAAENIVFTNWKNSRDIRPRTLEEIISADKPGQWEPWVTVCGSWCDYVIRFNTIEEMFVDLLRYRFQPLTVKINTDHCDATTGASQTVCDLTIDGMDVIQVINYLINCMRDGSEIQEATFEDYESRDFSLLKCRTCYTVSMKETQTTEEILTMVTIVINEQ